MSWVYVAGKSNKGKGNSKGQGSQCPTTRVMDGDWTCGACKHHNFAFRDQCQECFHPAPKGKGKGKGKSTTSNGNHVEGKGNGKGNLEHKGKGKGKGYVPGSSPTPAQTRNQRKRAQRKSAMAEWTGGKEDKEKDVEITRLKKELAKKDGAAQEEGENEGEAEEVETPEYLKDNMLSLMKHLGFHFQEAQENAKLLSVPRKKDGGTAEETVNKLVKTSVDLEEAQVTVAYFKEKVTEAAVPDNKVPAAVLCNLKKQLKEAETKAAKIKGGDTSVNLDNMAASRATMKATETARLLQERLNKEKAASRSAQRKKALEEFSVAVTMRIANHMAEEEKNLQIWEAEYTDRAKRAQDELDLMDSRMTKAQENITAKMESENGSAKKNDQKDSDMEKEEEKKEEGSQFNDSDVLKALQAQLKTMQERMDRQTTDAEAATSERDKEFQALNAQRNQEIAFLRQVENVAPDSYKIASKAPTDEAKDAMIRTHQILSDWNAGGAAIMFTMAHLDLWAGLQGETRFLLEHLMGEKQAKVTWKAWFPEPPQNNSIVPRQMARIMEQILTKSRQGWEKSQEHSQAIRKETDGIFTTLSLDAKRRCVAVISA